MIGSRAVIALGGVAAAAVLSVALALPASAAEGGVNVNAGGLNFGANTSAGTINSNIANTNVTPVGLSASATAPSAP